MAQSRSEYDDGDWDDREATADGADDANILANTPLLLLTLPLDEEEPLPVVAFVPAAAVAWHVAAGGCEAPAGFSGKSEL